MTILELLVKAIHEITELFRSFTKAAREAPDGGLPPPTDPPPPSPVPPPPPPAPPGPTPPPVVASRVSRLRSSIVVDPNRITDEGDSASVDVRVVSESGAALQDIAVRLITNNVALFSIMPSIGQLSDANGLVSYEVSYPQPLVASEYTTALAADCVDPLAKPLVTIRVTSPDAYLTVFDPDGGGDNIPSRVYALGCSLNGVPFSPAPTGVVVNLEAFIAQLLTNPARVVALPGVSVRLDAISGSGWVITGNGGITDSSGRASLTIFNAGAMTSALDLYATDPLSRPVTEIKTSAHGVIQFT